MNKIGKERGWATRDKSGFDAQSGKKELCWWGVLKSGRKDKAHSDALGGISRVTFQMDTADLPHENYWSPSIDWYGYKAIDGTIISFAKFRPWLIIQRLDEQ